jgi:hypothetical protein
MKEIDEEKAEKNNDVMRSGPIEIYTEKLNKFILLHSNYDIVDQLKEYTKDYFLGDIIITKDGYLLCKIFQLYLHDVFEYQ